MAKKSKKYITLSDLPGWIEKRCPRTFQKITITQEQWKKLFETNDAIELVLGFVELEAYLIMQLVDVRQKELAMLGTELKRLVSK